MVPVATGFFIMGNNHGTCPIVFMRTNRDLKSWCLRSKKVKIRKNLDICEGKNDHVAAKSQEMLMYVQTMTVKLMTFQSESLHVIRRKEWANGVCHRKIRFWPLPLFPLSISGRKVKHFPEGGISLIDRYNGQPDIRGYEA